MKDPRIKVGNHGVGLVLEGFEVDDKSVGHRIRYVITAVDYLPRLPPPSRSSQEEDRIYRALLGPRGNHAPTVSAECVFCDVVSGNAILACLDKQNFPDNAAAYVNLVSSVSPLTVSLAGPDPEAVEINAHLECWLPGNVNIIDILPGWLLHQVVQAYHNPSDEHPGSHRPS
jgi:hypothetical protein